MNEPIYSLENLRVTVRDRRLLEGVNLQIPAGVVFAVVGPSGAGKSTLLKVLNRMCDFTPGLQVHGQVKFHGVDLFEGLFDCDAHRARVGMLFQQPVIFPGTILDNVMFGLRHVRRVPKRDWEGIAARVLAEAALWDQVKDRLHERASVLSVGQQQRLCLARTLALDPEVILMDEPTSALDPQSTGAIEDLISGLRGRRTIVLVTHDLDQARRVAHSVAELRNVEGVGRLIRMGSADEVLGSNPLFGELPAEISS